MQDRERRLECQDCQRLFWSRFRFNSLSRLLEMANVTNCEYCLSDNWITTSETRVKHGDIGYRDYQLFTCDDCEEEFYVKVSNQSSDELARLADVVECPECEGIELRIEEYVLRRTMIKQVDNHIVHPFEHTPEDSIYLYD